QFALPEAVEALRAVRRGAQEPETVVVAAADPLNLVGVLVPGARLSPMAHEVIAFRDGAAVETGELGAVLSRLGRRASGRPAGACPGADSIVAAARLPLVVFPVLLALVAYAWARARFGRGGGLLALALVVTYPDVLGHGALVTTDVPSAAVGLASGFALDQLV